MMKNYMTSVCLVKGKKPEEDPGGKATTPIPGEEADMSIYSRPVPHESWRKLKLIGWEVNVVTLASPE
jgi:hypothetical protein